MNAFAALNYLEAFSLTVFTCSVNFESIKRSVTSVVELEKVELDIMYRARANISRGLYTIYPILEDHFFAFKEFFQKIMSLCIVSILERFLIESGL